jgi:hypothetical protein
VGGPQNDRMEFTGVKHFPTNKIRLSLQQFYFDETPCVIIVPIMSLQQVLDWDGAGYRAIVLAGGHDDTTAADVYRGIHASFVPPGLSLEDVLASGPDIEMARVLLTAVVRGLAYSLHHTSNLLEAKLSLNASKILTELRHTFTSHIPNTIQVPSDGRSPYRDVHARVVKFVDHGNDGHPAPDPLLLAVKSAINWSWRNQQKLLATGELVAEEDEMDICVENFSSSEVSTS